MFLMNTIFSSSRQLWSPVMN